MKKRIFYFTLICMVLTFKVFSKFIYTTYSLFDISSIQTLGLKRLKNVYIVIESKEYLEKYRKMLFVAQIGSIEENKRNNLAIDLSNFSIASNLVNIDSSSSSLLPMSITDVNKETADVIIVNYHSFWG